MHFKKVFPALLLGLSLLIFGACSKSEDGKGPMEKAGKSVDDAMVKAREEAGQALEKAGQALKGAGEKVREGPEKTEKQ
jgi:hypothetical protein